MSIPSGAKDTNTDHTIPPGMAQRPPLRHSSVRARDEDQGQHSRDSVYASRRETIVTASDVPVTVNHQKCITSTATMHVRSPTARQFRAGAAQQDETGTVTSAPAATPAPVLTGGFLDALATK